MRRLWRWLAALSLLAVALTLASVFALGERLIQPAQRGIGAAPAELQASDVMLQGTGGLAIAGWLSPGREGAGAVLLVHGVRASRRVMLGRARFLHRLGYTVLLIDLPAHGASSGDRIHYGLVEAEAVRAALGYLARERPREKVGVIAVSLGAAALVLAQPLKALQPDAVVLESMFPTIRQALVNRLQVQAGAASRVIAPVLLWYLQQRVGAAPEQLAPIAKLPALHVPSLIASGTADAYTTVAETQALYAAANAPKSLWLVPGAAHVDLHAHDPAGYERRVSQFLQTWLRPSVP